MSADKRTVTTDALETLGTIITENEKRDAIHLAVENVIAGDYLKPGQHVTLRGGVALLAGEENGKAVGIVDPFLAKDVARRERFWLVVYPRQISSLRHVWEHPDFPPSELGMASAPTPGTVEHSKKWIADFAANVGLRVDILMQGAADHAVDDDEYLCFGGLLEGEFVPDEFWRHYEIVAGQSVPEKNKSNFFTCSC